MRDATEATGAKRAELRLHPYRGRGYAWHALLFLVLGFIINRSRLVWFAPFRVVLFSLIVAYGMLRENHGRGRFLNERCPHGLLTVYLLASIAERSGGWCPRQPHLRFHSDNHTFAHIAAALVITFAMAPCPRILAISCAINYSSSSTSAPRLSAPPSKGHASHPGIGNYFAGFVAVGSRLRSGKRLALIA